MTDAGSERVRDVRLGGLENARDVGGYVVPGGRRVRWGRVFRAASLHELDHEVPASADDWSALGLATVVDLRRADERERRGTVSGVLHPAGDVHLPAMQVVFEPDVDIDGQPEEYLATYYVSILTDGAETVRQVFELLAAEADLPLVMFCAAGKDRTGTVVALVLAALGVPDEVICDDYELSGERVSAMVDRLRSEGRVDQDPMVDQHPTILRAPRGAMALLLDHLHNRTPGIEGYLASIGVSAGTLAAVRANLLETDPKDDR